MNACSGQPISWLRLEQYVLGELPEPDRDEIASHLATCAACGECFARIEPTSHPALPPLAAQRPGPRVVPRALRSVRPVWLGAGAGLIAAAAALLLWVRPEAPPSARMQVKGGELALELTRLDSDGRLQPATHFVATDRFKALVTCPPDWHSVAGVVVYQAGKSYTPLGVQPLEHCGNRVPLAGAWRINDSARALVCATFAPSEAEWQERVDASGGSPPTGSVCTELEPGGEDDR